jgi:hypothetical protein
MSESKHTPTPWVWKRLEYDQPHVPEYTLEGPDVLCRYWRDERPSADALLIAAAPTMLEALARLGEVMRQQLRRRRSARRTIR